MLTLFMLLMIATVVINGYRYAAKKRSAKEALMSSAVSILIGSALIVLVVNLG